MLTKLFSLNQLFNLFLSDLLAWWFLVGLFLLSFLAFPSVFVVGLWGFGRRRRTWGAIRWWLLLLLRRLFMMLLLLLLRGITARFLIASVARLALPLVSPLFGIVLILGTLFIGAMLLRGLANSTWYGRFLRIMQIFAPSKVGFWRGCLYHWGPGTAT